MTITPPHPCTRVGDWPRDSGPLAALIRLGFVNFDVTNPGWVRYQRVYLDDQGRRVFTTHPIYLTTDVIRGLAALTFEGYSVDITPADNEIQVRITERSETDAVSG